MNFEAALAPIKELTEENDSIGAFIAGCELLKKINPTTSDFLDTVQSKLERIQAMRDQAGYLPPDLYSESHVLYKKMLDTAKGVLGPDLYKKFYMSF